MVVGWKLRTLIKDGVFTSHQVPVVPSVAGAEACRNGARGRGGASTDRGRAYHIPLKLTVSQSVRPSTLIYLFDPNLHRQPRHCPRHPPDLALTSCLLFEYLLDCNDEAATRHKPTEKPARRRLRKESQDEFDAEERRGCLQAQGPDCEKTTCPSRGCTCHCYRTTDWDADCPGIYP